MNRNNTNWLIAIIVLLAFAFWLAFSKEISLPNPFTGDTLFSRNVEIQLGLDLRGGLQTLLEADLPEGSSVTSADLQTTRQILEKRLNPSGTKEVLMQTVGDRRIVAEFPGEDNPENVIASLVQTGLLEFVDTGDVSPEEGTILQTDYEAGSTPVPTATPAVDGAEPQTVYHTIMTGKELATVGVSTSRTTGRYGISFTLTSEGTKIFGDHTSKNVHKFLTITVDKRVISAPRIDSAITSGQGEITGNFTAESANALAAQLRYGSLPVPVKVVESRTVGATLGEESVRKSLTAGYIGLGVVILFMILYYRLPGFIADMALIGYAVLSLAIFKLLGVVLTLPGIAGFILSIGMAVDANILIFERLKEELRAGRNLRQAIDLGWSRAWPSIRDSNISTLITCAILFIFGNTFGASMVRGFSINLFLGVAVSLFTAIIVTRTFLHAVLDNLNLSDHPRWFGL
jgi:preprotein translocase subunit SecD